MINKFTKKSTNNKTVAVLDIGSSKIVCLIATIVAGKIKIIGTGCHSAHGFKNGNISNAKSAKLSIISAVDQAEKAANRTIERVILSLNGNKIKSLYLQPSVLLKKNKVSNEDIKNLAIIGLKEIEKKGYEVIHYFPLEYIIDNNNGINDPIGLLGHKLSARIHFVGIPTILLDNLIDLLASCQLDVEDCVFSPYVAGLSTLNEVDKELGSILIDFGAGITSYAIFAQNNMVNCGSIPVGGAAITADIAKSFMIDFSTAERIKNIHGSANVYSNEYEVINYKEDHYNDYEDRNILKSELNQIIHARLEEILLILKDILEKYSYLATNAKHNIVITGGGSILSGITSEITRIFKCKTRLGKPTVLDGLDSEAINASYSASIGTIHYILKHNLAHEIEHSNKSGIYSRILQWIKENY